MKELFCSYEQSLALKELMFNEKCIAYYSADKKELKLVQGYDTLMFANYVHLSNTVKSVPSPLLSQAFKFFREKYSIEGYVVCIRFNSKRLKGYQYVTITNNYQCFEQLGNYNTYEEAEQQCLNKLIEIVKND